MLSAPPGTTEADLLGKLKTSWDRMTGALSRAEAKKPSPILAKYHMTSLGYVQQRLEMKNPAGSPQII